MSTASHARLDRRSGAWRARAGAALIGLTGLIHLVDAPEYFEQVSYLGVLFALNFVASAVIAGLLWRRGDRAAWILGVLVAAGSIVGFVASRTVGLPGFFEAEWELLGVLSMFIEAAFIGVAALALSATATARD